MDKQESNRINRGERKEEGERTLSCVGSTKKTSLISQGPVKVCQLSILSIPMKMLFRGFSLTLSYPPWRLYSRWKT
jgi:hypothetical protein